MGGHSEGVIFIEWSDGTVRTNMGMKKVCKVWSGQRGERGEEGIRRERGPDHDCLPRAHHTCKQKLQRWTKMV